MTLVGEREAFGVAHRPTNTGAVHALDERLIRGCLVVQVAVEHIETRVMRKSGFH